MSTVRIASLHIHPVKGMRGLSVPFADAGALGLRGDREWTVVRDDGRCVTQRELPRMATLSAECVGDTLQLHSAEAGSIVLDSRLPTSEPVLHAILWRDRCEVVSAGEDAARWITAALGAPWPCRIVRMRPGFRRALARSDRLGPTVSSLFADAAPYLVTNTASLLALNAALRDNGAGPVGMERFRPNIVVSGLDAFAEQGCVALHGGEGTLRLHYPSDRCVVITTDQRTGERDNANEPFATLRSINASPPPARAPLFGMNASWSGSLARLGVGDELEAEFA